jgi:hypothetical protein
MEYSIRNQETTFLTLSYIWGEGGGSLLRKGKGRGILLLLKVKKVRSG